MGPLPSRFRLALFLPALLACSACGLFGEDEVQEVTVVPYEGPFELRPGSLAWDATVEDTLITLTWARPDDIEFEDVPGFWGTTTSQGEQLELSLLHSVTSDLPVFVSFNRSLRPDYTGTYRPHRLGSLVAGEVRIQDWDPAGVISGEVQGRLGPLAIDVREYFWVDLSADSTGAGRPDLAPTEVR